MNLIITKACSIKNNEIVAQFQAGDFIALPDDRGNKIISAGRGRSAAIDDYRSMINDFGQRDPGGVWEAIKQLQPETWSRHIQAIISGDIATAKLTFNEMVRA
jgi:hypothetical protein